MYTTKTNLYDISASTGADFLDRTVDFIDKAKSSKIVKMAAYAVGLVAGLFALGGVLRVLAWTTAGWNQFAAVLRGK